MLPSLAPIRLGLLGQATRDRYCSGMRFYSEDDILVVSNGHRNWKVRFKGGPPVPGAKITAAPLSRSLLSLANYVQIGGGALNTLLTIRKIADPIRLFYVDGSRPDRALSEILRKTGRVTVRFLRSRALPENLVLGARSDKLILKKPITSIQALNGRQIAILNELLTCPAVLANSGKDLPAVRYVAENAAARGVRVSYVLTPSLPLGFLRDIVLPTASLLIANWDELGTLTGLPLQATLTDAQRGLNWLREHAPQSDILITLGKEGALTSPAGQKAIYHVRLRPQIGAEVQRKVTENPGRTCGAGDAFAGAAFLDRECGLTLLEATSARLYPSLVRITLSGCVAALRWLGYERSVTSDDFELYCLTCADVIVG